MSEAKRLWEQATPLPWQDIGYSTSGHGAVFGCDLADKDGTPITWAGIEGTEAAIRSHEDAALIVYAVNRLPDYEALRETVEAMWDSVENDPSSSLEKDLEWERRWSRVSDALRRLRGES